MSKTFPEMATEITSSLHEELYQAYVQKNNFDPSFQKDFGEYVGEQFQHILKSLNAKN
ncbi:TPA: hypothetical protein ACIRI2_001192 [Streptococcus suis]|uniref:hypothetical protein n=1 Tax=Streptococcus suis TaxID=1307 RepID=UPI0003FD9F91|nr:hypothetical protein [Streptococcus suis]MCK4018937.1 hypothetical protein [Streptococcus suis]NQK13218.1 hypothetical protein [Streptococcus suis]HEL1676251.1 hypothetical protein [Streptococcus suis]HEL2218505.1 hypothetical protein [Streptococcus suis]HEM3555415.1 hypothetical protein [Streptococcus suis]